MPSSVNIANGTTTFFPDISSTQDAFDKLQETAESHQWVINNKKTNILSISKSKANIDVFLEAKDGTIIKNVEDVKILGFHFDKNPDPRAHVSHVTKKASERIAILRMMRKEGLSNEDLVTLYTSSIRSVIEYASAAYHPMLTKTMSRQLENIQKRSLQAIFGYLPYERLLELSGLKFLEERRCAQFDKFVHKSAKDERFASWFPLMQCLRKRGPYLELGTTSEALRNSPMYAMRRHLNKNCSVN